MKKELVITFVVVAIIVGFAAGVLGGYDLARRQVDATKLSRDLMAINTCVTTLELNDRGGRPDVRQLNQVTMAAYAKEAKEKAMLFQRSPVRDARLIQSVARAEAWAKKNNFAEMAQDLDALHQRLEQTAGR